MDAYAERLRQQLHHDHTRNLLTKAGLFLLAPELVKAAVIQDVKAFLCWDLDDDFEPLISADYRAEVLDHGRKRAFGGSVDWLVTAGALDDEHRETIDRLKTERDRVAHEALALVVDPDFDLDVGCLIGVADVLQQIGRFFGMIHVDSDPAHDNVDVDPEDIESGKSVAYSYVLDAVRDLVTVDT